MAGPVYGEPLYGEALLGGEPGWRYWGPRLRAVQEALRQRIVDERATQSAELPAPLQGSDFFIQVNFNPDRKPEKAYVIQVLPAEASEWSGEVTRGLDGVVEYPVVCSVKTASEDDAGGLLRELVGLTLDAIQTDPGLGETVTGWASPAVRVGELVFGPGVLQQEVRIRLMVRGRSSIP